MSRSLYGRVRGGTPDAAVDRRDMAVFAAGFLGPALRGLVARLRAPRSFAGVAFLGRGVRLEHRRHLRLGAFVKLERHVQLNGLSTGGVRLGERVTVGACAQLLGSGTIGRLGAGITVGANTAIGSFNVLWGQGGVVIGRDTLLGPHVVIVSANHGTDDLDIPIKDQPEVYAPITIGDGVWVGAGVTILAGSRIGDGAVVAANTVVRGEVAPMTVVAGSPHRVIGVRGHTGPTDGTP